MKKIVPLLLVCLFAIQLPQVALSDTDVTYVHNDRVDERAEYKKRVLFLCAAMVGTVAAFTIVDSAMRMAINYRTFKKIEKYRKDQDKKLDDFLKRNGYSLKFNPETHVTEVFNESGEPIKMHKRGIARHGNAHFIDAKSEITQTPLYNFINEQGDSVTLHGT